MNNVTLEWVDSFKYLEVRIDSKLKWGAHIVEVTAKANRALSPLRWAMYGCTKNAKKRAYTALVRPHLEYYAAVWNPYQQKDCETLEKVQRRAARWIGPTVQKVV